MSYILFSVLFVAAFLASIYCKAHYDHHSFMARMEAKLEEKERNEQ